MPDSAGTLRVTLGLAARIAIVTAVLAVGLVLGATELALRWSARMRTEDTLQESVALATTLGTFLTKVAPRADTLALGQALAGWSSSKVLNARAAVFLRADRGWAPAVASLTPAGMVPSPQDSLAWATRQTQVSYEEGDPAYWVVSQPVGPARPYGVLHLTVTVGQLDSWTRRERRFAYPITLIAAALVAGGVGLLTARWVGRPLGSLDHAMAGAYGGAEQAPSAPEVGPTEFRRIAHRYNDLRGTLATRERESEARRALLGLEERARAFDRLALMEATTAEVAHEIGSPLNTVSGHLQLLRDDLDRDGQHEALERVNLLLGQVDRLAAIVRRALQQGSWPAPTIVPADLNEVARQMLDFLEPSLRQAGIGVVTAWGGNGEGRVRAACDPAMVEQILLNLFKNALEAVPPGGRITIRTGLTNGLGFIEVADDGPGLAPEARVQLFDRFATTKGPMGTGLGLAVSRRLARALNGDLVHQPAITGTCWRLTLPKADPA